MLSWPRAPACMHVGEGSQVFWFLACFLLIGLLLWQFFTSRSYIHLLFLPSPIACLSPTLVSDPFSLQVFFYPWLCVIFWDPLTFIRTTSCNHSSRATWRSKVGSLLEGDNQDCQAANSSSGAFSTPQSAVDRPSLVQGNQRFHQVQHRRGSQCKVFNILCIYFNKIKVN